MVMKESKAESDWRPRPDFANDYLSIEKALGLLAGRHDAAFELAVTLPNGKVLRTSGRPSVEALTPWMQGALQAMRVPYCTDCGGKPGDHAVDCTKGDLAIRVPCTRPCPAGCAGDSTPESCPVCLGTGVIDVEG